MGNPNTTMNGTPRGQLLKWPSDIDSVNNGKGLMFHIFQYSKDGTSAKERSQAKESIVLPLPAQLEHSDEQNWQNVDNDLIGGARAALSQLDRGESWMDVGWEAIKTGAQASIGEQGGAALAAATGKVRNPRELVGFERTSFKTHSFSFKMIPRNEDESQAISDIVTAFRQYSHPEPLGGEDSFQYRIPHVFRVEFMPKELNRILYRPGDSILQSISISYGDEGGVQLFNGTNQPVETTITLQFQEMFVKTSQSIKEEANQ